MLEQRRLATFMVVVIAATVAPCGFASTTSLPSPSGAFRRHPDDVRIELQRDYLVAVRGSVGDRGGLTFVVDTGTLPTLVDTRIARRFGKPGPKCPSIHSHEQTSWRAW